jgi:amino-acid N-acetyltransferase
MLLTNTAIMETEIEIKKGNNGYRHSIVALLQSENLPVDDLTDDFDNFFIAVNGETVVGAIGLEQYDDCGLLRSLIVHKDYRNEKIAGKLVARLEAEAATAGIRSMYLLTETAPLYFTKKGYEKISREEVPQSLQQSSEFSHVCPQSAIVMKKSID